MCCRDGRKTCPWNGLLWFCRLWGLITAAGFWGVGIETAVFHRTIAIYFIFTALILLFLEIVFLIDIWLSLCISDDSTCMKLWQYVLWIDTWKKGILYILLCWPSFLHLQNPILGILAGVMLLICAILYITRTFETWPVQESEKTEETDTYDRFPEIHDVLEDNIINPPGPNTIMLNIADQNEIIQV
ncbi:transmembrane protein 72 isoform X1 [Octopus bimaculoides]|uniref:Transmembrane protein 72 n=1 Tax=Octopus bimaculoides TaxID=37653 RepID=A0A0L8GYU1_OCTBM|nr:transmembrane protein 72 isoform X1 [Octopus bimaculoides]|eukprot:XP_014777177.1 PREDICTED: transmembrane protein 72-like [Octopus bimaculoides]